MTGSGGGHGGGRGGGRGSGRRGGSGGGEDVFPVEEQVADLALRVSEGCVGRCRPIFFTIVSRIPSSPHWNQDGIDPK